MKEDDIKEAMIRRWKNGNEIEPEKLLRAEPEAHYSYFGKRGVADLFVVRGVPHKHSDEIKHKHGTAYEVKTRLEEPHKILRQFNRMVYAFFEDENRTDDLISAQFELTIAPTKHNLEHLIQYQHLYSTLHMEREQLRGEEPDVLEENDSLDKFIFVHLRHPRNLDPIPWSAMWKVIKSGKDLPRWVEDKNPKIAKSLDLID
ncbi:hypothetical protein GLT90_01305 [Nanohaloarchaea archaeon H12]|nr:hypothetical protein [Nanohaloarchaea archaeon H12]